MEKPVSELSAIMQMLTGHTLDEYIDVYIKDGEETAQEMLLKGVAEKRKKDDLFSPENMFKRPE